MDTKIEKFTKGFFWTGYVVFLSASIPHIAAYFRHFDPITSNRWEDASYWIIATAIAIVIDVSDVLVSIAVMRAKASGAKNRDVAGFWVFIVFITALSWFFNWQYNVVFGTSQFQKVDQYTIAHLITIGQVNPVLGSAFQALLLVYTMMAHKFTQKPKTAAELQSEAERLEGLEKAQNRINAYYERTRKPGLIQRAKETAKEVKAAVNEVVNDEEKNVPEISQEADESEDITESITDAIPEVKTENAEEYSKEYTESITEVEPESFVESFNDDSELSEVLKTYPKVGIEWLAKDRKTVTIEEIITVTGQSKRRVNKAGLQRSSRNRDLILVSSILEWLKTAPKPEPKAQSTDPLPVLNGHRNKDTKPLDNLVELEV